MTHEVMRIVRNNQLLVRHSCLVESSHQIRCLTETDVAIVVTMNQQHRRLPCSDRRNRRRLPCDVKRTLAIRNLLVTSLQQSRSTLGGPIVHAVSGDARGTRFRMDSEGECGQKATVRTAINTDPPRINLGQSLPVFGPGFNVPVLRGTLPAAIGRAMEVVAVTDSESIVH